MVPSSMYSLGAGAADAGEAGELVGVGIVELGEEAVVGGGGEVEVEGEVARQAELAGGVEGAAAEAAAARPSPSSRAKTPQKSKPPLAKRWRYSPSISAAPPVVTKGVSVASAEGPSTR